jgi:hypothetical protein
MPKPYVLFALAVALLAAPLSGQEPTRARGFAGGDILFAFPVGEFEENVDFGIGIGAHGRLSVDERDILSLRADLGFLNYGNETRRVCVTQPCLVTGDLTTSNNIFLLGIGPEIGVSSGSLRLYANASLGLAYFNTTSSIAGSNNSGAFASSTNLDDWTFAWTAGPGAQLRVWSGGRNSVSLDLAARYHGNGEAEYLREGDIVVETDGTVLFNPQRTETN